MFKEKRLFVNFLVLIYTTYIKKVVTQFCW